MASDPKKPYGDVTYADPGYQSDGVKRYPIDTEAHCRAAWSYINQSKNASKYSSNELAKVKAKIRAALKRYGADVEDSSESSVQSAEVTFVSRADAQFRVNPAKRTIWGQAIPWGDVARSQGRKFRFLPGSLEWGTPSRVKVLREHDGHQPIGKAITLDDNGTTLDVTLSIARGEEGTRALELAEDGVLDGLSVGVDFIEGHDPKPDPQDRSVLLVKRAILREVSLTAMPSFDSARITDVAASRTKERETMPPAATDTEAEAGAQFDLDAHFAELSEKTTTAIASMAETFSSSVSDSLTAGFKTALETLPAPQDGPQSVRAARFTSIREAPVYSLNMAHPGHSLVKDAYYAATTQDQEAKERLRKYRMQSEDIAKLAGARLAAGSLDATFATATTVTDPEIIPPGYRPDLYVPQLAKERPLVSSASHGTISNATPFVVPVFTSITTGSAVHVEGTNPTDGTLAFSSSTVSPIGISGLLKLTREIVDSSNPAIDAIALQAMRESYSQQTETALYTLLNGTSGAGGTITTDNVPSGAQAVTVASGTDSQTLVKMVRERLAKYPFQRFASPGAAHMGSNATVKLATAVDTTQRPLFPSIGATNSNGLGNAVQQAWNVDGLPFVPSWAMTGVAAGDSQILFWNSADVWVWESALLSFRYEERSGPALIELAMFGYYGNHVLRPVGLSGIRIT